MRISIGLSVYSGFLILALIAATVSLAGCSWGPSRVETVYKEVKVPVAVGCVVGSPEEVPPLRDRLPSSTWAALAPGAKAQAVKAQAGERMNYSDGLRASTSGCKPVEPK